MQVSVGLNVAKKNTCTVHLVDCSKLDSKIGGKMRLLISIMQQFRVNAQNGNKNVTNTFSFEMKLANAIQGFNAHYAL